MPSPKDLAKARSLFPQLGDTPDVLIAKKNGGHSGKHACVHVWSSELPQGSLLQVAPGIRCASPLLLPVLLASKLSKLEMAILLSELMGLYAICEDSALGLLQRRAPLTTPYELTAFLANLEGAWGSGAVKRALQIAPVMSASPLEAKLYLRVTLPHAKGGYNMGEVVLNDPQAMRRLAFGNNAGRQRKPDLLFKGRDHGGVCLDYMGPGTITTSRCGETPSAATNFSPTGSRRTKFIRTSTTTSITWTGSWRLFVRIWGCRRSW